MADLLSIGLSGLAANKTSLAVTGHNITNVNTPGFSRQDTVQATRIPQFSVMLLNCVNLDWDVNKIVSGLDSGAFDYRQLMQQLCIMPAEWRKPKLPFEWNSLEHYEAGKTCLIQDVPGVPNGCRVQFDDRRLKEAFGWWRFRKSDFEERRR